MLSTRAADAGVTPRARGASVQRPTCAAFVVLLAFAGLAAPLAAQVLDLSGSTFDERFLVKKLGPDGFKALSPPSFVPASYYSGAAAPAYLRDDDWCIVVGSSAGAGVYPVPVMIWHEVANDRPAGPGAGTCVSYCILSGSAVVFDEDFGGTRKTDFGVSGYLYQSNLVMFDYQTRSMWPQLGMEARSGVEKGRPLPLKAFSFVRWSEAKAIPGAQVCDGSEALAGMRKMYAVPPMPQMATYPEDATILSAVDSAALADARFPSKDRFAYFPGSKRAVSFSGLARRDHPLVSATRRDGKLLSVAPATPEPFITLYWFGLMVFHPDAAIDF
jgi:hypothetical protein